MKKIRVMRGGCGISYEDVHGIKRHILKTPENGPFECDDIQAERLVCLGVAEYVQKSIFIENFVESEILLDSERMKVMTVPQLKQLANDRGIDVTKISKKADIIETIISAEDNNEFPNLNPEEAVQM